MSATNFPKRKGTVYLGCNAPELSVCMPVQCVLASKIKSNKQSQIVTVTVTDGFSLSLVHSSTAHMKLLCSDIAHSALV